MTPLDHIRDLADDLTEGMQVSEHPNTARGDVAYWGLTHVQAAHYHARISRMYANRAAHFRDLAVAYAQKAIIASRISLTLAIVAVALVVIRIVVA